MKISAIILAGGEGKRMDGIDKGLANYNGQPLIKGLIDKLQSQVDDIVISANRNIDQYKSFGYPVVTDTQLNDTTNKQNYNGPLAGIASALPICTHEQVFIIACDMPLISKTVVARLVANLKNDDGKTEPNIVIAEVNNKLQLAMLINKNLLTSIENSLNNNQLKLMQWVQANQAKPIAFAEENEFQNFNYFEDLWKG